MTTTRSKRMGKSRRPDACSASPISTALSSDTLWVSNRWMDGWMWKVDGFIVSVLGMFRGDSFSWLGAIIVLSIIFQKVSHLFSFKVFEHTLKIKKESIMWLMVMWLLSSGLLTATVASRIHRAAQPALLYLVPFTLLPLLTMAYLKVRDETETVTYLLEIKVQL